MGAGEATLAVDGYRLCRGLTDGRAVVVPAASETREGQEEVIRGNKLIAPKPRKTVVGIVYVCGG